MPERPGLSGARGVARSPFLRNGPRWLIGLSLVVAIVFPLLPYFKSNQFLLVLVLVYALVGVSLTMLVGWAGQVSLGQFALVGIGAYLTAKWAGESGWSVVELLGRCRVCRCRCHGRDRLARSAGAGPDARRDHARLGGHRAGLALSAGLVGGSTPFNEPVQAISVLPGFGSIGSQLYLYYVVLVVLVLVVAAAATLRRSAVGRSIIAVRDNERAVASFGIKPVTVKLRVLALSGFVAAAAGVIFAIDWQSVTPTYFDADLSIAVLAIPVVGGLGSLGGAVAAAVLLYMGSSSSRPHLSSLLGSIGQNVGFFLFVGGISVIASMMQFPNGIAGMVQERWQAHLNKRAARLEAVSSASTSADGEALRASDNGAVPATGRRSNGPPQVSASPASGHMVMTSKRAEPRPRPVAGAFPLVVDNVAVHFGGIAALGGTAIEVRAGRSSVSSDPMAPARRP